MQRKDRKGTLSAYPIYTIGHSTRSLDKFISILQAHSIMKLVDIRTVPRSRFNPQFNKERLAEELPNHGIEYLHMKELGGLRHPKRDSINNAWRNQSFRGFADYMQTDLFKDAVDRLVSYSKEKRVAMMCAEGSPFRCHRSLVADALTIRGIKVIHLSGFGSGSLHSLTRFAKTDGLEITYPEPNMISGEAQ
ncbi:MAG: DUF488 domain-containing protein [Nitrososphaerota archaeon]|jgi:uncharacterized protein (DUF488 family)|nr:DUF488 domain-containing protein [Nitrososphaerota archaeon]